MMRIGSWSAGMLLGLLALCGASGCKTVPPNEEPYPRAASRIPFVPQVRQVAIQAGGGVYPNLFTGASHAIWNPAESHPGAPLASPPGAFDSPAAPVAGKTADPVALADPVESAMEADRDAVPAPPRGGPLVIRCRLESVFQDRSIAYDAVGLRGLDVYLRLPDGQEVLPAQRELGAELTEEQVGALRRYAREVTLYFPSGDFRVENPAANPAAPGVRLVIEGHNSAHYFEWRPLPNPSVHLEPRADYKAREAVKKGYRATSGRAKRISHTFD